MKSISDYSSNNHNVPATTTPKSPETKSREDLLLEESYRLKEIKADLQKLKVDLALVGVAAGAGFLAFQATRYLLGKSSKNPKVKVSSENPEGPERVIIQKTEHRSSSLWDIVKMRMTLFAVDFVRKKVEDYLSSAKEKNAN